MSPALPLYLSTTAMPADPFESFDSVDFNKHHPPPVPEPRFYGALLLTLCLALVVWVRFKRNRISHLHP